MTTKELYEGVLTEVAKEQSPHIQLYEFNHYANEAVSDFVDDIYIAFEASQKSLDYLKAIKRTINITTAGVPDPENATLTIQLNPGDYPDSNRFDLPSNYRHLTNLIVNYNVSQPIFNTCYEVGDRFQYGSKRLDSDRYSSIIADPWNRPRYFRIYHSILDQECYVFSGVHPGLDIESVQMDYLKTPKRINITLQQAFQDTIDNSEVLEFDDIASRKILDKIVQKILERNQDPRTSSHSQINQLQPPADVIQNVRQ